MAAIFENASRTHAVQTVGLGLLGDRGAAAQLPAEVTLALDALVAHVAIRSGCAGKQSALQLGCSQHARWMSRKLAIIAEAVRRAEVVDADPGFCNQTFVALDWGDHENTPGEDLQQAESLRVDLTRVVRLIGGGERVHVLAWWRHLRPDYRFGPGFQDVMFAHHAMRSSCAAEVAAVCGADLSPGRPHHLDLSSREHHPCPRSGPPALGTAVRAVSAGRLLQTQPLALRPRPLLCAWNLKECNLAFHSWNSNGYQGPEFRKRADLCRLARSYEAARELFPIATPFEAGDAGVVNVAVHVRAGPGSKSVPESAYVAALEATARALQALAEKRPGGAQVRMHVHAFHEYDDGRCCHGLRRWADARAASTGVASAEAPRLPVAFFAHITPRRHALHHSLWTADMVVAGECKSSHMLAQISPHVAVALDGSVSADLQPGPPLPTTSATRLRWAPCGVRDFMEKKKPPPGYAGEPSVSSFVAGMYRGRCTSVTVGVLGGEQALAQVVRERLGAVIAARARGAGGGMRQRPRRFMFGCHRVES